MKRKLLTITTKGCTGCLILDNIIKSALSDYPKEVEHELKGEDELSKDFLKANNVSDFPTTIFYQDDVKVFMFSGTRPKEVIRNYMNIHFD